MRAPDLWVSGPILAAAFFILASSGISSSLAGTSRLDPESHPVAGLSEKLRYVLPKLSAFDRAEVVSSDTEIMITLYNESVFEPGTAEPVPKIESQFKTLADTLTSSAQPWRVLVEGHTEQESKGRNRWRHPSNWELSGARAFRIVRIFEEAGIPGGQLQGIGFAATQPGGTIGEQNRRIVIRIQPFAN